MPVLALIVGRLVGQFAIHVASHIVATLVINEVMARAEQRMHAQPLDTPDA